MMLSNLYKIKDAQLSSPTFSECLRFGVKHIKKIYPLYIILVLACLIPSISIGPYLGLKYEIPKFLLAVSLLQSLTGMMYFSHAYNGVAWFLSSLFCIYLICPFLIFYLRKISKSLFVDILLIFVFIFLSVFLAIVFGEIQNDAHINHLFPELNVLVYESPFRRVFYVLIGMSLSMLYFRIKERVVSRRTGNIMEFLIVLMAFLYYILRSELKLDNTLYVLDIIIVAGFILIFAFERGFLSDILKHKIFQVLGNMAMYIFLIHYPLRIYGGYVVERFMGGWNLISASLFCIFEIAISFFIAWKLYKNQQIRFYHHRHRTILTDHM